MDKVLFLDIDGVLNSEEYIINRDKKVKDDIDIKKVFLLEGIVRKTNCSVVLSSSWRFLGLERINNALGDLGSYISIKHHTTLKRGDRGKQILEYIKKHNIKDYVVLDDEIIDIKNYIPKERLVKTSWEKGLQKEHSERVIKILNKEEIKCD